MVWGTLGVGFEDFGNCFGGFWEWVWGFGGAVFWGIWELGLWDFGSSFGGILGAFWEQFWWGLGLDLSILGSDPLPNPLPKSPWGRRACQIPPLDPVRSHPSDPSPKSRIWSHQSQPPAGTSSLACSQNSQNPIKTRMGLQLSQVCPSWVGTAGILLGNSCLTPGTHPRLCPLFGGDKSPPVPWECPQGFIPNTLMGLEGTIPPKFPHPKPPPLLVGTNPSQFPGNLSPRSRKGDSG